ncbi:macrolide family glycosyltransferase [Paenibacillus apis]|uniref:Glycosyl transferase family 1 n=1 Tax=Paenibacillus apis TaxID=1792174 RepID=A0A919Y4C4_9BACL|nr:macrolide family glycosyltransferase [Paenibacillus apis]GIO44417.1 glycosyl transferase family 1 [Paenibacillus apis]
MARVLFINGGSEGHINPTIGVVQELVSRGEKVVYFCIEAFRERLEKAGASVRTFDDQKFIKAFISGGRDYLLQRINGLLLTADIVIPGVLAQIKGERFDYIIHDSMFGCGRILAQILNLPAISSCTTFALTEAGLDQMLEPFFKDTSAEAAKPIIDQFHSLTAGLKEAYGVEIRSPYEVYCNPAPLTLVYTTRTFQPDGGAFGQSFKFVGPSIASRSMQPEFDLSAIQGKACVYISLGTVFNQAVDFYRLCLEAFGDTEYTVVMAVGDKIRISDLGTIPDNFIVNSYVPQMEVLQYTKLFITHGGMNSAHEGLYYGVPLLVIPQSADQPLIAEQVVKLGAGIALRMQSLTAAELLQAANQVLAQSSFRESAERVGASFRQSGGYRQAADEILKFKAQILV